MKTLQSKLQNRRLAAIVFACIAASGCDSTPAGRLPVYPARGTVTIDGQPADGAILTFFGQSDDLKGRRVPVPMATVNSDGTYEVRSYGANDGMPVGDFRVTLIWPEPIPEGEDVEFYEPKDRLAGKYSNPAKSEISVSIVKGTNEIPAIDLNK
jgi:hypothetical protein